MVLSLEDMSVFGALLHIAGSVLIVYGQTIVKVAHCIQETSGLSSTWLLPATLSQYPQWYVLRTSYDTPARTRTYHQMHFILTSYPHAPRHNRRRPDGKWRRQLTGSKTYATVGWAAFAVGNLMRFVSMRFAAQTVLSGLGSLQFVVIPAASRQLLGIRPQLSTALGVVTVLLGNLLIIGYGPPETAFSLPQLRRQWSQPSMRGFLLLLGIALASLHVVWRIIHKRRRVVEAERRAKRQQQRERRQASLGGDVDLSIWDTPGSKEADLGDPNTLRMFVAALLFSAVSSFIGAWSVLFSKSLTYVVSSSPASLFDWYSWFTVLAFLGTAGYWIRQSDKGLKLYPATLIMPLMQAFWMAMSVLEGMIYFDEMRTLTPQAFFALSAGLVLAIAGAVAMGLSGFFNEQPQMVALAAAASHATTSPLDVERSPLISSTDDGGGGDGGGKLGYEMAPLRMDGLSSPVLREREKASPGERVEGEARGLGAMLVAEVARVAAWRQKNQPLLPDGRFNGE